VGKFPKFGEVSFQKVREWNPDLYTAEIIAFILTAWWRDTTESVQVTPLKGNSASSS